MFRRNWARCSCVGAWHKLCCVSRVALLYHPAHVVFGESMSLFVNKPSSSSSSSSRHHHRHLALGLARKLARLGDLFVVFPERGHWFFHLLLRPLLPWVRMHVCVMCLSARCVSGYVCALALQEDRRQTTGHTYIHTYVYWPPSKQPLPWASCRVWGGWAVVIYYYRT